MPISDCNKSFPQNGEDVAVGLSLECCNTLLTATSRLRTGRSQSDRLAGTPNRRRDKGGVFVGFGMPKPEGEVAIGLFVRRFVVQGRRRNPVFSQKP